MHGRHLHSLERKVGRLDLGEHTHHLCLSHAGSQALLQSPPAPPVALCTPACRLTPPAPLDSSHSSQPLLLAWFIIHTPPPPNSCLIIPTPDEACDLSNGDQMLAKCDILLQVRRQHPPPLWVRLGKRGGERDARRTWVMLGQTQTTKELRRSADAAAGASSHGCIMSSTCEAQRLSHGSAPMRPPVTWAHPRPVPDP